MKTADFDYQLPAELIAQRPLPDRAASRMMVLDRSTKTIRHDLFANIGTYLRPGDLLVLNDTRVIPARIWSEEPRAELLLLENIAPHRWTALAKPGRKLKLGTLLRLPGGAMVVTVVEVTPTGERVLEFQGDETAYLQEHGAAPLPPYIQRDHREAEDLSRYQTVFARTPGAVAAPTAGLHFTPELLAQFPHAFVTLHVGIGTFRPVKTEAVEEHHMHSERFSVSAETAARMREAKRIVAVGTTVVRTLETLGAPQPGSGTTEIFIRPGFAFQMVGAMLTNFHLPKSTLLMLVSAFADREFVLRAYAEAVRERYRFFSYGDCMLIL